MNLIKSFCILTISLAISSQIGSAQSIDSWITNGDQSALLVQQPKISFSNTNPGSTITINQSQTFQTVDGFGFCLTQGSAQVISALPANQQDAILNEFFNPTTGMGNDVVRISIGASDLSAASYSYDENGPDLAMNNFSLNGLDMTYLIPMLKKIVAINPSIKILATPWSAPRWMKTNNAWIGGSLQGQYYQAYANYFVKYLDAMKAQGLNIWAITPQNEPENPYNEPSMTLNSGEETTFINNNLGPTIRNAGYATKIIAYDHNLDDTSYPIQVCNGSSYVDGAAFHLYAGNITDMTTVHNATGKNVYFTEQYTSNTGGFSGDFSWHTQNVTMGSMNNWGKTAFEWNLANDQNFNPRTPGGCTTCQGAITVTNGSSYSRNVSYYIIAQFSKFIKTGAVKIGSTCTDGAISQAAFKNTDGSISIVVYNNGGARNFTIGIDSRSVQVSVPGYSAITLKWRESIPSTTGIVTVYKDCPYTGNSAGLSVGDYTTAQLNALGILNNDISSINITEGYKVIAYDGDNFTGASTTITSSSSCLTGINWNDIISSIRVQPNGMDNLNGSYFLQNRNSGLFMDVTGGLGAVGDGANIQQYTPTYAANQQFSFTDLGNGTYKILSVNSGKSLDVQDVSLIDGGNIQQWTDYTANNQQFIVVPTGDGYFKLVAKHSGKIIEVASALTTIEANVQQWTNNNQTCGQWKFIPTNAVTGTGNGLRANYFNGMNFETPVFSRIDQVLDVNWGNGSPDALVNADAFSARWTGQIQAKYTGTYTFTINADNGRRLWINNQLVIDKWIDDCCVDYSGTIDLTAGQKYDIKEEYFENVGGAENHLYWSTIILPREVVPQSQLYANQLPIVSITGPANNSNFNAMATIPLTATASDPDGSIAKVVFYNGSTIIATISSSPFNYSWTNVGIGQYTIIAKVYDNMGAVGSTTNTTVNVNAIDPTITMGNQTKTYGDANFSIAAISNSSGAITYSIISGGAYASITSGGVVTIIGAGSVTIQASQAANGIYNAKTITSTLTINKLNTTGLTYTGAINGIVNHPFPLKAIANSKGKITYQVQAGGTGAGTIKNDSLFLTKNGSLTILISIAADANYNAQSITQLITIDFNTSIASMESLNNEVVVYPNPTTGILTIKSGDNSIGSYELFDIQGVKLSTTVKTSNSEQIISISELAAGTYVLKINMTDGFPIFRKIIKE